MTFALGPRAADAGHRLIVHDSLDSTNSEALRLTRAGDEGPLWLVAREQTAGRGRRGRAWISDHGNLATSLLFVAPVTPPVAATLGFVASLAVHQACTELAPGIAATLKWPNDVLVQGRKVAGLLLESESKGDSLAIVVGIGVNIASAPENMPFPAASLLALGHDVAPEAFFTALTDAWLSWAGHWNNGRGFDVIRTAWLARAQGIGQSIAIRTGERVESGVFETLDEQGRLILRAAGGTTRAISAGDVYFGDAAGVES